MCGHKCHVIIISDRYIQKLLFQTVVFMFSVTVTVTFDLCSKFHINPCSSNSNSPPPPSSSFITHHHHHPPSTSPPFPHPSKSHSHSHFPTPPNSYSPPFPPITVTSHPIPLEIKTPTLNSHSHFPLSPN